MRNDIERIVLIDDDTEDCDNFKFALQEVFPNVKLYCVHNCHQVKEILGGVLPDLVFLDINMPAQNGFECLREFSNDKILRKIPIIMYSSSRNEKDVNISYGLGASLYFRKPDSFSRLMNELRGILELQWEDPNSITSKHYRNGEYFAYTHVTNEQMN